MWAARTFLIFGPDLTVAYIDLHDRYVVLPKVSRLTISWEPTMLALDEENCVLKLLFSVVEANHVF